MRKHPNHGQASSYHQTRIHSHLSIVVFSLKLFCPSVWYIERERKIDKERERDRAPGRKHGKVVKV